MSLDVRGVPAKKLLSRLCLAMAVGACAPSRAQNAPAPAVEASPALGERLADLGTETLANDSLSTAQYREAALLFQAAHRVSPAESRFPRFSYEASLQAGEVNDAIVSLIAYSKLDTTDFQSQIKLVELYAQRMETAEAKLKYLRDDLLGTAAIPAEIRSHAAILAARMLLERGERATAAKLAEQGAGLNPYNSEAQRLRFDLSLRDGTSLQRLMGLLAIVRASPLDPGAVASVAAELDEAGMDESSTWYDAAVGLSLRSGAVPSRRVVDDYAARLSIIGTQREMRDAETIATRVTQADPNDVNAQIIRAAIGRVQGDPAEVAKQKVEAVAALSNAFRAVADGVGASTGDPMVVADKVIASDDAAVKAAFSQAAANFAFFQIYFAEDVASAAPYVEALRKVEPAGSAVLARLDGWAFLVQKREPEAKQKLSAVEASDPLASMGMLRMETDKESGDRRARDLRSHAHGTVGAIVASELASRKVPLLPTQQAEAMRQTLNSFPSEILRIIDSPQNFYMLRADPVSSAFDFGEPALVRVTVMNLSNFDLPLGPRGAIHPDIWVDATVRGLHPQAFPRTAFDRLAGPLVLRPKQAASRVIRLDQGRLLRFLRETPFPSIPITGVVCTNPISPTGQAVPGPGGQQVGVARLMEQSAIPGLRPEQRDALVKGLATAPADKRPALIEAAQVYAARAVGEGRPEDAVQIRAALDALSSDPDITARTWGTFMSILHASGDLQLAKAKSASADGYWLLRMLSLAGIRKADPAAIKALATQLTGDPEPLVARYAQATLDEMSEPAMPAKP